LKEELKARLAELKTAYEKAVAEMNALAVAIKITEIYLQFEEAPPVEPVKPPKGRKEKELGN